MEFDIKSAKIGDCVGTYCLGYERGTIINIKNNIIQLSLHGGDSGDHYVCWFSLDEVTVNYSEQLRKDIKEIISKLATI